MKKLRQITETHSLVEAAQKLHVMGPSYVIIKKGEHGALLFHDQQDILCPRTYHLEEVFDPTGAGDSFIGGFAGPFVTVAGRIQF